MKIIIISDIKGNAESIIPYGLNLAKYLQSEVDILHTIDSRFQHGVSSSYADSQSLTPGSKMSHEEILQREKTTAHMALDKVLSREASVLNYPLKINTIVEENSVKNGLSSIIGTIPNVLVLVNSQPDDYTFHSHKEIIDTFKNSNFQILVVPPGKVFREFNKVVLATNFSSDDNFDKYPEAFSCLNEFNPHIDAVDVAKPKKYLDKELKSKAWLQVVEKMVFLSTIKTNVLTGNNYLETLRSYIDKTKPDLVLSFKRNHGLFNNGFDKNLLINLIEKTDLPVLY